MKVFPVRHSYTLRGCISTNFYNYYTNPKADSGTLDVVGPVSSIYAYYEGNYESAMGVSFEYNKGEISKIKRGGYNYEFTKEYGAGTEYVNEGMTGLAYNFRSTTRINNSLDIGKTLYDAGGNLTATVYGNTNYHTYDRDVLGRITVKNTLRDKLSYTYNSKGLLAGVSSEYNNTSQMYSYDFAGRMSVSEFYDYSNDVSQKHKYTYDSSDMLTGVKSVFSKEDGQRDTRYTTYEYDREGRISEQDVYREGSGSIYLVPKIRYNYNDVGLLTSTVYSGANQVNLDTPITRGITYKTIEGNPNRLSSLIDTFDGYSYTYDNVGNIKSVDGPSINSATYIYDEANQLVKASGYYDTEQFEYDYNGNITKYHNVYYEQGYTNEYEYTYNYDSTWKDRLSSITSDSGRTVRAYTYGDQYSAGSTLPTSDGRFNFEWDGRMLTRATRISDNTAIDYKYDENGQRIEKKVTSGDGIVQKLTKYYYTDGALTTEVNYVPNNGTMIAETKVDYIYDNTGLAFVMVELYNNDNHYFVSGGKYTFYAKRNAQGDVTSLVDITNGYMGDSIQYTYSAYGRRYIESVSGDLCDMISKLNTLTFKSYSYDSDLGMYYLGSRWYDPEVCRFINADSYVSTGQGITGYNMFAYCGNNPVNRADPDGEFFGHIIVALIIIGGILVSATSCSKPKSVRADIKNAPALDISKAPSKTYNCYGNALKKQINTNPTGYQKGDSTESTFAAVQSDLGGEKNCKQLSSIDSPVDEGWYKVALMCGDTDYHFIRLTEDGWHNKSGAESWFPGCYVTENMVANNKWYPVGLIDGKPTVLKNNTVYYNEDGPLYFEIRIGWDN